MYCNLWDGFITEFLSKMLYIIPGNSTALLIKNAIGRENAQPFGLY